MKITVVVITKDIKYASAFSRGMKSRYGNELEISIFSKPEPALEQVRGVNCDIIWADMNLVDTTNLLPKSCRLVYMSEKSGVESVEGTPVVMKYQSIVTIYNSFLDIYSEKAREEKIEMGYGKTNAKILTFLGGAGGVGTSTVAVACAKYIAQERKEPVLYLNLEQTGTSDLYFQAEGQQDFGKVLIALFMNNSGSAIKVKSALKQDISGVYFYSGVSRALDMLDVNEEVLEDLFEALNKIDMFKWIIVDMDFQLSEMLYQQIGRSMKTILLSDGSLTANKKLLRKIESLQLEESQNDELLLNRVSLLYNRFRSNSGKQLDNVAFEVIGKISRIDSTNDSEIIQYMVTNKKLLFDDVLRV